MTSTPAGLPLSVGSWELVKASTTKRRVCRFVLVISSVSVSVNMGAVEPSLCAKWQEENERVTRILPRALLPLGPHYQVTCICVRLQCRTSQEPLKNNACT